MKQLLIFIQKEFYHIFRDRRTLLILLGIPIVLVILFGFAITNEINDARIVISDQANDEVSREITERLLSSGYFRLDRSLTHAEGLLPYFQRYPVKLAVVFPGDLQERFHRGDGAQVQLVADATDPNTAATLINYATAIIKRYEAEQLSERQSPLRITTETRMLYNPEMKGVFLFVPGVMTVILMLVSAMMTSIAITKEKELGTMEVLLVSPLKPSLLVLGKVIPYILLAMVNTAVILLLGTFMFGMPVKGDLALLIAECLLFVLAALALGILISTRTDSQQVAMLISLMALMLPTILLSGFIFPIESMPWPLQWLSHIIPAKWFIIIIKNIMLKGTGIGFIWKETLVLVGMTVFFLAASVKNFKIRLA
jgi:ABC-2 type transport system permease protein